MKKKSIQTLSLKKTSVSALNANTLTGGNNTEPAICQSVAYCETIDYSACRGENRCRFYKVPTDQTF